MKEAATSIAALLYPAPGSLLHEDYHQRLVAMLDDPLARQALRDLVAKRIERQRIAGYIWDMTAAGANFTSAAEEPLVQASSRLAALLEARRPARVPMPRVLLIVLVLGCLLGALAIMLLRYVAPTLLK